jgi:hypothetical protein
MIHFLDKSGDDVNYIWQECMTILSCIPLLYALSDTGHSICMIDDEGEVK